MFMSAINGMTKIPEISILRRASLVIRGSIALRYFLL